MEIELLPDPRDDLVARAAAAALAQEGLMDGVPPASGGAWRRAGLRDAVDRDTSPDGSSASRVNPTGTNPIDPSDAGPGGSGSTG